MVTMLLYVSTVCVRNNEIEQQERRTWVKSTFIRTRGVLVFDIRTSILVKVASGVVVASVSG
jgi:hypothetical protein